MENEIRSSIKTVYGMLWEIIALYEKTECYNKMPKDAKEEDVWDYSGNKLLEIQKEINTLFLGEVKLRTNLLQIVDESEHFIRSYEKPGVVTRWKKINPQIVFFGCALI